MVSKSQKSGIVLAFLQGDSIAQIAEQYTEFPIIVESVIREGLKQTLELVREQEQRKVAYGG